MRDRILKEKTYKQVVGGARLICKMGHLEEKVNYWADARRVSVKSD